MDGPPFLCPMISRGAKYWSTEKFTGQDRTVKSRLIHTPQFLSVGKNALTLSLDSTLLIRTLSMALSMVLSYLGPSLLGRPPALHHPTVKRSTG